jgi:uncharacterized lipoprotein YmbA
MKTIMMCLLIAALLAMAGCSHRAPTIAHVHIGHAMTGWHDTPGKQGLFIVAEQKAAEALAAAQLATGGSTGQPTFRQPAPV